jgi:hypothetical protein
MILDYFKWKLLLEEEEEQPLSQGVSTMVAYHVSSQRVKKLENIPLWFALEKSHSDEGWFANTLDSIGQAFQYKALIEGKIGRIDDPNVLEIFNQIGEDPGEWQDEIVGNPSADDAIGLRGTQGLIKAGYAGIIYLDYDPRDFSKDLDALLVFRPLESIKRFKLVTISV